MSHRAPRKGGTGNNAKPKLIRKRKRLCAYPQCSVQPSYGYIGQKPARCSLHKELGMVDVQHRHCEFTGCVKQPHFAYDGQMATFCSGHKLPGMVNVRNRRCEGQGCVREPIYAMPGERPRFCSTHKFPEMINVKSRRCVAKGCTRHPLYWLPGQKASYCSDHKTGEMMYSITRKCEVPHCQKLASARVDAVKEDARFCSKHKKKRKEIPALSSVSSQESPPTLTRARAPSIPTQELSQWYTHPLRQGIKRCGSYLEQARRHDIGHYQPRKYEGPLDGHAGAAASSLEATDAEYAAAYEQHMAMHAHQRNPMIDAHDRPYGQLHPAMHHGRPPWQGPWLHRSSWPGAGPASFHHRDWHYPPPRDGPMDPSMPPLLHPSMTPQWLPNQSGSTSSASSGTAHDLPAGHHHMAGMRPVTSDSNTSGSSDAYHSHHQYHSHHHGGAHSAALGPGPARGGRRSAPCLSGAGSGSGIELLPGFGSGASALQMLQGPFSDYSQEAWGQPHVDVVERPRRPAAAAAAVSRVYPDAWIVAKQEEIEEDRGP
ncbi:unnamed protein product [Chrysoparadoxa australica]